MTTREARGLTAAEAEEESIAAYLQRNPDFFERHQAVLARLRLPHARGGTTISLVERQIEVLREKQAAVENKLAELVRVARANDAISERLHRFTRRLLQSAVPREQAVARIEAGLREDFDAFSAALVLIGEESAPAAAPRFVRTVPASDPNLKSFETLFSSGKPRCGQARDSQRGLLAGPEGGERASGAGEPFGDKGGVSVLAVRAAKREQAHRALEF